MTPSSGVLETWTKPRTVFAVCLEGSQTEIAVPEVAEIVAPEAEAG